MSLWLRVTITGQFFLPHLTLEFGKDGELLPFQIPLLLPSCPPSPFPFPPPQYAWNGIHSVAMPAVVTRLQWVGQ